RNVVDARLERARVGDRQLSHVEDFVAVVGDEPGARYGLAALLCQSPGDQAARHGYDLDGQRKSAEHVHLLAGVDNAHETRAGRRHYLLPRQRSAAALDQAQVRIDLVGAVDIQRQVARFVEIKHPDTVTTQAF